jgi:hypothetical protein
MVEIDDRVGEAGEQSGFEFHRQIAAQGVMCKGRRCRCESAKSGKECRAELWF